MSGYNHTPADDQAIATIRTLAVDMVGKANSGHPGCRFSLTRLTSA
jgi:transketolase